MRAEEVRFWTCSEGGALETCRWIEGSQLPWTPPGRPLGGLEAAEEVLEIQSGGWCLSRHPREGVRKAVVPESLQFQGRCGPVCVSCSVMSDSLWSHGVYSPRNSLGKNTGVGIFQGILPTGDQTQVSHIAGGFFLHCRQILYQLSHKGSPRILESVAYPFFSRSSQPRDQTKVSCIADGFFTNWAIRET